jgi:hypothetical protein
LNRLMAALGVATIVLGSIGLVASRQVSAAQLEMEGVATGAEENPAVAGPGSVRVRFVFDDAAGTLTYAATVNGLSQDQVLAAHIHRAARGTNGPIVINLSLVPFTQTSGTVQLTEEQIADLRAGNLYFNAHSKENPGGFARFQLVLPSAPAPAATAATGVLAPNTGDAGLVRDGGSTAWLPFAALALAGSAGVGALVYARRRA